MIESLNEVEDVGAQLEIKGQWSNNSFKYESGHENRGRLLLKPWIIKMLETEAIPGLEWVNKERTIFQVPWKHRSKKDWRSAHSSVFLEWAKNTGKWKEGDNQPDYARLKTRLRCAFSKAPDIVEIKSDKSQNPEDEPFKLYRIIDPDNLRAKKRYTSRDFSTCQAKWKRYDEDGSQVIEDRDNSINSLYFPETESQDEASNKDSPIIPLCVEMLNNNENIFNNNFNMPYDKRTYKKSKIDSNFPIISTVNVINSIRDNKDDVQKSSFSDVASLFIQADEHLKAVGCKNISFPIYNKSEISEKDSNLNLNCSLELLETQVIEGLSNNSSNIFNSNLGTKISSVNKNNKIDCYINEDNKEIKNFVKKIPSSVTSGIKSIGNIETSVLSHKITTLPNSPILHANITSKNKKVTEPISRHFFSIPLYTNVIKRPVNSINHTFLNKNPSIISKSSLPSNFHLNPALNRINNCGIKLRYISKHSNPVLPGSCCPRIEDGAEFKLSIKPNTNHFGALPCVIRNYAKNKQEESQQKNDVLDLSMQNFSNEKKFCLRNKIINDQNIKESPEIISKNCLEIIISDLQKCFKDLTKETRQNLLHTIKTFKLWEDQLSQRESNVKLQEQQINDLLNKINLNELITSNKIKTNHIQKNNLNMKSINHKHHTTPNSDTKNSPLINSLDLSSNFNPSIKISNELNNTNNFIENVNFESKQVSMISNEIQNYPFIFNHNKIEEHINCKGPLPLCLKTNDIAEDSTNMFESCSINNVTQNLAKFTKKTHLQNIESGFDDQLKKTGHVAPLIRTVSMLSDSSFDSEEMKSDEDESMEYFESELFNNCSDYGENTVYLNLSDSIKVDNFCTKKAAKLSIKESKEQNNLLDSSKEIAKETKLFGLKVKEEIVKDYETISIKQQNRQMLVSEDKLQNMLNCIKN